MFSEDLRRLEKIDELYSLRLDQLVALPALVVVGDQSSGKSSVLEALTGLPLPRDAGLCTRFPTQIQFIRAPTTQVDVSIVPSTEPDTSLKSSLQAFSNEYSSTSGMLGASKLLEVLEAAANLMHVPAPGRPGVAGTKSFSNDILKIEVSGPQCEHFSIVDLPGLFRKPTPGQTTKQDTDLVRKMVSTHINNPRSIILAVVPANVDTATQEIVQMAEDADPTRKRTLGVLTKPDLVDKGAESNVINLVVDRNEDTGLGYVVVCNRSQSSLAASLDERHANEEAFFERPLWQTVPKNKTGVPALKKRLNTLLVEVTRLTFDQVQLEICRQLLCVEKELAGMGQPRHTPEAQRLFLLQLASRFQSLTQKASDAYYGRDECFQADSTLRLAGLVMTENENFSDTMYKHGLRRTFTKRKEDTSSESDVDVDGARQSDSKGDESDRDRARSSRFPELSDLWDSRTDAPEKIDESVDSWIRRVYREFKGFEVGGINPSIISLLVFEQTRSWGYIARRHVLNVIMHIHRCIKNLMCLVCTDQSIHDRLWAQVMPSLRKAYDKALRHVEFLVATEREGYPITVNHYFSDNLKKRRRSRISDKLKSMKSWHTGDEAREPLIRLQDTLDTYVSNEQQNIDDLSDVLRSYLKVARKRFVDNVCKQAVDHFLICSGEGPLHVFTPEYVGQLEEPVLVQLVKEDDSAVSRRKGLERERQSLRQGQSVLQD